MLQRLNLFSMSSSYWRSFFYLKQLQAAVAEQQDVEQERILTNLIVHVEMLKKPEARKNLQQMIQYLKSFFLNEKLSFQNRLYAQALYLVLNEEHNPREVAEFEILARFWFELVTCRHELSDGLSSFVKKGTWQSPTLVYLSSHESAVVPTDQDLFHTIMDLTNGLSGSGWGKAEILQRIGLLLKQMCDQSLKSAALIALGEKIADLPRYNWEFNYDKFAFQFLPYEIYKERLNNAFTEFETVVFHDKKAASETWYHYSTLVFEFCEIVNNLEQIDEWLMKFNKFAENVNFDDYHHYDPQSPFADVFNCLILLACKKKDVALLNEWLIELASRARQTLYTPQCMLWVNLAMKALPFVSLNESDYVNWADIIYRFTIENHSKSQYAESFLTREFLNHMSTLLPLLPHAKQEEYSKKIHDLVVRKIVYSDELGNNQGKGFKLPNLLRSLPDEMIFELNPVTHHRPYFYL